MLFGLQRYPEGHFPAERGTEHNWRVRCNAGALEALKSYEHVPWLMDRPDRCYTISFADGSAARIRPKQPLWKALAKVAEVYKVEVFRCNVPGGYVPWTGADSDLQAFDVIRISLKAA